MLSNPITFAIILGVQVLCAVFFVSDILISVFGLTSVPISWQFHELIEIGASVGLLLGVAVGAVALRHVSRRNLHVESQLRVASGAFAELIFEKFNQWQLTPAERDVALFALKGLSTSEIAALRETSEGTVKAQTNAIYRKAGVSGRAQLMSLFVDDLMSETLISDLAS
ncbi:helix-turn-helix transcriptional regulator [Litoreibacter roseus]|uniref:LuxR family transcriptional regulator n=1 Tax=Litoreibacter roseus TaxID=2601869 RepID=A0A6N6JCG5_9RHOB|nr:LuxR C-terminal-related transcriptional regulator [Litoreibacter roseus]GFE63099.1 LuxR family transcriptional regulator [Litoreibacter roseus]